MRSGVEVAVALEAMHGIAGVYALDRAPHPDAYEIAVALDPFSISGIVEAHSRVLGVASYERCGRVIYVDAARTPPLVHRCGRVLRPDAVEREFVRMRAAWRAADAAAIRRASLTASLRAAIDESTTALAIDGARVRILEIASDPFPTPLLRVAAIGDRPERMARADRTIDLVPCADEWQALEALGARDFDLILCAAEGVGAWTPGELRERIAALRPTNARRLAFVPDRAVPLDPVALRQLAREVSA